MITSPKNLQTNNKDTSTNIVTINESLLHNINYDEQMDYIENLLANHDSGCFENVLPGLFCHSKRCSLTRPLCLTSKILLQFSLEKQIYIIQPLILNGDESIGRTVIDVQTKLISTMKKQENQKFLPLISPSLIQAFENHSPAIRKQFLLN